MSGSQWKIVLVLVPTLLLACGGLGEDGAPGSSVGAVEGRDRGQEKDRSRPEGGGIGDSCIKFEDEEIGASGLSYDFGTVQVSIDGWTEKGDSPGEQIGFSWTVVGGDVDVRVKTGGETYENTLSVGSGTWIHPEGTEGPEAPAISHIVFCAEGDPGAGGSGGGGSGGGEGGAGGGQGGAGGGGGVILD